MGAQGWYLGGECLTQSPWWEIAIQALIFLLLSSLWGGGILGAKRRVRCFPGRAACGSSLLAEPTVPWE